MGDIMTKMGDKGKGKKSIEKAIKPIGNKVREVIDKEKPKEPKKEEKPDPSKIKKYEELSDHH